MQKSAPPKLIIVKNDFYSIGGLAFCRIFASKLNQFIMKTMKKWIVFLFLPCWAFLWTSCATNDETEADSGLTNDDTLAISSIDVDDAEDSIANTPFDRTIYIAYASDGVTITGDSAGIVSADGSDVTVVNTTSEKIIYELSGTCADGYFKTYSNYKQAFVLNGLNLTNKRGAAINNQGKKRCFVVVKGTNTLADGSSYTLTPSGEDEKAALFSEGQLIFSGDGTLDVTATGKAGITSDDYLHFMSLPTINVTSSAGHALRGKEAVIISDGTLSATATADMKKGITSDSLVSISGGVTTIKVTGSAAYDDDDAEYTGTAGIKADQRFEMYGGSLTLTNTGTGGKGISGDADGYFYGGTLDISVSGSNYGSSSGGGFGGGFGGGSSSSSNSVAAKGIKFDGNLTFAGSKVGVSCKSHEGIEAKGTLTISDGIVYSYSASDDAVNSGSTFTVSGGYLCGYAPSNDALDANGNFYVKGGTVYAIGSTAPEVALDANTEERYALYIQGGTLVAIGGLESGATLSQSCYQASSWTKNTWYALTSGSTTFAFKTPSSGGTGLVVSAASTPTLKSGVTVSGGTSYFDGMTSLGATVSGGSSVSLSTYSGGTNGGGPGGGRW